MYKQILFMFMTIDFKKYASVDSTLSPIFYFLDSFNVCARRSINACFPHNHLCVFISIFPSLCCFQFSLYFKWLYFISSFLNSPSQCFIVSLCCLLLSYFYYGIYFIEIWELLDCGFFKTQIATKQFTI